MTVTFTRAGVLVGTDVDGATSPFLCAVTRTPPVLVVGAGTTATARVISLVVARHVD